MVNEDVADMIFSTFNYEYWQDQIAIANAEAATRAVVSDFVRRARLNSAVSREALSEDLTPEQYQAVMDAISAHPSWTNDQIADELLNTSFASLLEEKRAKYNCSSQAEPTA